MVHVIYVSIFFFGLIIGSFLNCLVWRLYKGEKMSGRSYCPKCEEMIAWYDNIPVLSFILLGGRCRRCKKKISWQYPLVELATGALFVAAFFINGKLFYAGQGISDFGFILNSKFLIMNLKDWFLVSVMIVIFVVDLRWYLILDIVTLPAAAIIFIINLFLGFSWSNMIISGIMGGSFFLIQFMVSRGKWIGGGDIRLGLLMGVALGWPDVLTALFLAYFIGSVIGVALIVGGKKEWSSKVPLGTFLTAATVITMFWGERILGWYLNLF